MRQFGIIGRPLGHSASARHFTAKFQNEGLDCHFEQYELPSIEALPELLERGLEMVRRLVENQRLHMRLRARQLCLPLPFLPREKADKRKRTRIEPRADERGERRIGPR